MSQRMLNSCFTKLPSSYFFAIVGVASALCGATAAWAVPDPPAPNAPDSVESQSGDKPVRVFVKGPVGSTSVVYPTSNGVRIANTTRNTNDVNFQDTCGDHGRRGIGALRTLPPRINGRKVTDSDSAVFAAAGAGAMGQFRASAFAAGVMIDEPIGNYLNANGVTDAAPLVFPAFTTAEGVWATYDFSIGLSTGAWSGAASWAEGTVFNVSSGGEIAGLPGVRFFDGYPAYTPGSGWTGVTAAPGSAVTFVGSNEIAAIPAPGAVMLLALGGAAAWRRRRPQEP